MKKNFDKIVLKKNMTRDNCFILQQVWDRGFFVDYFGNKNPFLPVKINYVCDGVVEFWEYEKTIDWFMDSLLEKNLEDKNFLTKMIKDHLVIVKKIKKLLINDYLKNIAQLKSFIKLLESGAETFLAFYYSAVDYRTPVRLRSRAIKIRQRDSFYDDADRLIRKTIEHLYPFTDGLTISILFSELDSLPTKWELEKRFKNCIMVVDSIFQISTLKKFATQHPEYKFEFEKVLSVNILKGQVASKGYARGVVRILKRKNQISSLKVGEVIVSPMTTPDFVSAIKRAVAVVTDEGGITCHAAIVSRELKIPCIIGTKVATQIFKDGDRVEVDANKGIVRKL